MGPQPLRVGRSIPPQDWEQVGFRTTSYDRADLGPGLQCVDTRTLREEDVAVTLVHAHYVFDVGQFSVVVTVGPTLDDVFAHMTARLHGLISDLHVGRSDGTPFAAGRVPGASSSPTDLWPEADLG